MRPESHCSIGYEEGQPECGADGGDKNEPFPAQEGLETGVPGPQMKDTKSPGALADLTFIRRPNFKSGPFGNRGDAISYSMPCQQG